MNLKDIILQANDCPLTAVEVPEWGCTVHLKPLSGSQRSKLVKLVQDSGSVYGVALQAALCDADGKHLFQPEDIQALNDKSGVVLERLSKIIVEQNGLGNDAVNEKKEASNETMKDGSVSG